jgi:hypothetical protein
LIKFRNRLSTFPKAVKGVVAAGVEVMRVEVDANGRIIVIAGKPSDAGVTETPEDIKSLV